MRGAVEALLGWCADLHGHLLLLHWAHPSHGESGVYQTVGSRHLGLLHEVEMDVKALGRCVTIVENLSERMTVKSRGALKNVSWQRSSDGMVGEPLPG